MSRCGHDKDIRDLCRQDVIGPSDIIPVYSGDNRDDRGVTGQAFLDYVNANLVDPSRPITQRYTPVTGFSVLIAPLIAGQSVRLLLTPGGVLAAGTVLLPGVGLAALPVDGQEVLVTTTNTITALTVSAGGTTPVSTPPTTITPNTPFKMFYDATNAAWYPTA